MALLGRAAVAAALLPCLACQILVWPPPKSAVYSGKTTALSKDFTIKARFATASNTGRQADLQLAQMRLQDAVERYDAHVKFMSPVSARSGSGSTVKLLDVVVLSADAHLGQSTRYDYNLTLPSDAGRMAHVSASSIYGAMYAMESFLQLIGENGSLQHSSFSISDAPEFNWRGLLVDPGKRFFPVPLVLNLVDTMAANKMNVLHLHASDSCRFGIESKEFPELTRSLTSGFYTQDDIKKIVAYAGARGIRVVPEFDMPGHARGLLPMEKHGLQFCSDNVQHPAAQVFADAGNVTVNLLKRLLKEMSALFPDEVLHIGCDETLTIGKCNRESLVGLEETLQHYVQVELGKTTASWEEMLFESKAANKETIVDAWNAHTPAEVTATGRRALMSKNKRFYFTWPAKESFPEGWSPCWYDIAAGIPKSQRHLLLGGEISMWTDFYLYYQQCGAQHQGPKGPPVAHELFFSKNDAAFSRSIGGMVWPRGHVAAAAFWNYNSSVNSSSPEFTAAIERFNDHLAARGSMVCPTKCDCDYLTACGKPYLNASTNEAIII